MTNTMPPHTAGALRLFVALGVPTALGESLLRAAAPLRTRLGSRAARWVRPEQLHLTLRFLGNVPQDRVAALIEALQDVGRQARPFDLRPAAFGCFPTPEAPRVLWAGVVGATARLGELQRRIVAATAPFAETPAEPVFTGHITLARLQRLRPCEAAEISEFVRGGHPRPSAGWRVEWFDLMRSRLEPGGAVHTSVVSVALGSDNPPAAP